MSSMTRDLLSNMLGHFMQNVPSKSYKFISDDISSKFEIRLKGANENVHCHRYADKFEAFFARSKSGNDIACLMIRPVERSNYTILFNHGGTVDLGNVCNFLFRLGQRLCCDVFVYDYSGFGRSTGTPTEKAIYADCETVMELLLQKYSLNPQRIVVYGQSLGTASTLYIATKHVVRGIILHSPFLSMAKLYMPKVHSGNCRFYDFFRNIEMVEDVPSETPVLVMHGTDDRVVPIAHGKELHSRARNAVNPLWVEGGGHNDLYIYEDYMKRLKRFFEIDLITRKSSSSAGTCAQINIVSP